MVAWNLVVSLLLTFILSSGNVLGQSGIQDEGRASTNETDPSWYRLPEYVLPNKYELWIFPRLAVNDFNYEGRVKIDLRVIEKTNYLMVNVVGLEIKGQETEVRKIVNSSSVNVAILKQELNIKRQVYILSFVSDISPGHYVLSLSFAGVVLDDLNGFYRSSYESAGKTRWLGVTQFSSIFARKAFPCFDEPYMKASYRLHIGHYTNETVTANTAPEMIREIEPGYLLTSFTETPPMSTYLVGWAIHNFSYSKANNSTSIGLWTQESMKDHGWAFLAECTKIYAALNYWIQVPNPITKMDQIAVPDFYWSAMENWGMVTFRESGILWEGGVTPTIKIRNGLSTVAHEYAHTWFGNLVTPKFWNVAWLKEGFATFFGHYVLDIVHSDWKMMDLFVVDVLQQALMHDSVQHNRTMNGKAVGSPESIPACMDFVTYKKGASIIRMMYHLIGDSAFHRGMKSYVSTLANKFAIPNDVYEHLQHFADQEDLLEKPIQLSEVVESWANQPGYPVITVTRNYANSMTEIKQEKFYLNESRRTDWAENEPRWWVPINFATVESRLVPKNKTIWITPQNRSLFLPTVQPSQTIICNIGQAYYYRVNYDRENWQRLINHLKSDNFEFIGTPNRASLLDDSHNLAKAGYIDYSIPLDLSRYLIRETNYEPWVAAITAFDFLHIMLGSLPDVRAVFQVHVNRLIRPIYENLTFHQNPSDPMRTRLLRNVILSTACSMNNENCLKVAMSLFKGWLMDNGTRINPDSKSAVYCAGLRLASWKDWHEVLRIFLNTKLHTEQELLIAGLGCTNNSTLIREFLNYSLYDGPEIRKQYRLTIFDAVLNGNMENLDHVLNFVDENLHKIVTIRGASFLSNIFGAIKKRIVLEDQLRKLKILVQRSSGFMGSSIEDARKAIEHAEDNISWIRTYTPKIAKWLNSNT